jgi:hypothetical protein
VALEGCDDSFCQRVKKAVKSDPGASGWVRVAGTLNIKPAYAPNFALVQVEAVQLFPRVTPAKFYALGLVAPVEPVPHSKFPARHVSGPKPKAFPSYFLAQN